MTQTSGHRSDMPEPAGTRRERREARQTSLVNASAIMAAGTVVSRLTGFGRAAIISAAIGLTAVTADVFNVPNVLPNMLYILVGGGVLNSVLVPAMVRAIKNDADGGQAYSQRLFSITVVALGAATLLAVLGAPLLIRLIADGMYLEPEMRPFFDNMVMFARFCLPQIFFYGLYVLIGQLLNAKGRFGPMMWAPIVNNVVAIAVFGMYLVISGPKAVEPYTDGEVLLLGLGSTAGVVLQALCLVPVLRSTGFTMRFRTDWRGHGLGHTARLGMWTFWFVMVNQIAYLFVVRVASGAGAVDGAGVEGAGYSVYANAMLIMLVPHSVLTVSLATALLPRMSEHANQRDYRRVRTELASAIQTSLAMIIPVGGLMAALSLPIAALIFDHGAADGQSALLGLTLAMLVPGLIAFTVHYLALRGFYALQDTRTPFLTQLWVSGTQVIAALAIAFAAQDNRIVTMLLAGGYSLAYIVGATVGLYRLQQRIGSLKVPDLLGFIARVGSITLVSSGLAFLIYQGFEFIGLDGLLPGFLANLIILAMCGGVGAAAFVGLAYLANVSEVQRVIDLILRRIRGRGAAAPAAPVREAELEPTSEIDIGQYLDETVEARLVETGTLSIFKRRDLDPEMTMEFFLDETLPGVPRHWDTTTSTPTIRDGGDGRPRGRGPGGRGSGSSGTGSTSPSASSGSQSPPTMSPYEAAGSGRGHPRGRNAASAAAHGGRSEITETTDPQDRLAGRYQVHELLDESEGVRAWRAVDTVLHRHVFVQTLALGDRRANDYVTAAQRAAAVEDSRFLRVLDMGSGDVDFVVREWTPGPSLATALSAGPLHPDEAVAVGAEVAEALASAHRQGLAHQSLDPSDIFILPDGTVKIAGLETDAALLGRLDYGLGPDATAGARDAAGVGGILYAALTARWPWGAAAGLSAAPRIDGRLATPRQVRPGVSRVVDSITDRAIVSSSRPESALSSPAAIAAELDAAIVPRYAYDTADALGSPPALIAEEGTDPLLRAEVPPATATRRDRRKSRTGRMFAVITAALLMVGLAMVGLQMLMAAIDGPDDSGTEQPPAASPTEESDDEDQSASGDEAEIGSLDIAEALDFDPPNSGGNDEENPERAAAVHDGDSDTSWQTVNYYSPLEDQKDGVGIFVRLEESATVTGLNLVFDPDGSDVEIRVAPEDADEPPSSYEDWNVVATIEDADSEYEPLELDDPVTTQYVLVWFTRLPQQGGDYKGGVAELEVLGRVS